jgi:hypothetical protein
MMSLPSTDPYGKKLGNPTIAMFIDAHTPAGIQNEANLNLARSLATLGGFDVTIFSDDSKVESQVHSINNIQVESVPSPFTGTEQAGPAATSLAVYHFLPTRHYDVVFFDANSNAGFHVITGQALGAKCLGAQILVGVTQPSSLDVSTSHPGMNDLSADYLRQRTIALSVCYLNIVMKLLFFGSVPKWSSCFNCVH